VALLPLAPITASEATAADATTPIATGAYHGCSASTSRLGLRCWGDNSAGELGDGTTKNSVTPVTVKSLPTPVLEVGASYDRTCALVTGRQVYCWGRAARLSSSGKPVASQAPVKIGGVPSNAHGLAVGVTHACILDGADATWCWGFNDRGQIGDGSTSSTAKPVKVKVGPARKVVASDGYTCVVLHVRRGKRPLRPGTAGGVSCWGQSHGTDDDPLNPDGLAVNSRSARTIRGLATATDVAATGDFACALLAGGKASCWGENDHGQLGDGTDKGRSTPAVVHGLPKVTQVVATANHACVLATGGSVWCWGRGDHGQMGDGKTVERHVPGRVILPVPATKLFGGASGHWALALTNRSAYAWGRGEDGQLGNGSTDDQPIPVEVTV
jgi:alpha-tubulin suppressor-like RCC1 family protein